MPIINSPKTDPNKILPITYPWARQYYKDGVANTDDQCPGPVAAYNAAFDDKIDTTPENGIPDCLDATVDSDGDTVNNLADVCPGEDDLADVDGDGTIDCQDSLIDDDRDGVANVEDRCPGPIGPYDPAYDDKIDTTPANGIPDCLDGTTDSDGDTVPIVALTAHQGAKELGKCVDAGCTDCLPKPFRKNTLIETIKNYTGTAHHRAHGDSHGQ